MLKTSLIALALAFAGATAASAQDYRAQDAYGNGGRQGGYGAFPGSDGGLGRYCPPGYYPHSSPNYIRCEPPGDTTQYIAPY
jgi:hypothetical protein